MQKNSKIRETRWDGERYVDEVEGADGGGIEEDLALVAVDNLHRVRHHCHRIEELKLHVDTINYQEKNENKIHWESERDEANRGTHGELVDALVEVDGDATVAAIANDNIMIGTRPLDRLLTTCDVFLQKNVISQEPKTKVTKAASIFGRGRQSPKIYKCTRNLNKKKERTGTDRCAGQRSPTVDEDVEENRKTATELLFRPPSISPEIQ